MISLVVLALAATQTMAYVDVNGTLSPDDAVRRMERRPRCNSGYVDKTGGRANWWACGAKCAGGIHWTDVHCNCACIRPTTAAPTEAPTNPPTDAPTDAPTEAPTKAVQDIFTFYDDNADQSITLDDLKQKKLYMKIWGEHSAGQDVPLTSAMITASKNEYFNLWEEIKKAAKALDVNGNGKINSHDLNIMLDERNHAQDMLNAYQAQLKTAEKNLGRPLDISFTDLDTEVAGYVADFNTRMDDSFAKLGGDAVTDVPHGVFIEYLKDVSFLLCFLEKVEANPATAPHLTAKEYADCLTSTHSDVHTAGGKKMDEFAKLTTPGAYNTAFAKSGARTAELEM